MNAFDLLGFRVIDRITGFTGIITSISFDLYGCVQGLVNPGMDKDGKLMEQNWFDIERLESKSPDRVMTPPDFGAKAHGPAEKPNSFKP